MTILILISSSVLVVLNEGSNDETVNDDEGSKESQKIESEDNGDHSLLGTIDYHEKFK
jgi:hypothetical protein